MTTQEFEYKGMHCKKWLSDNEKAKIQIIHGLGEMSEYYEQFAEYITAKGVSVYLCEYREHGRTALPADLEHRCFCSVTALAHRWLNMLFATAIARFTAELYLQAVRIYMIRKRFCRT